MSTTKRTLIKGLLPALLVSAALAVPADSVASPSPHDSAYAAANARQKQGRRAWQGWNQRYSRYGSDTFRLEGTFIGQEQGCALVRDPRGQVIPLLGNPGDLRKGDYLVMSGRIQNESVCGTAFRVFNMESVNSRDNYRYNGSNSRDRYYDDRYESGNRNLISLRGRLDNSGRCPVIRGDNGEYYDLVGDLRDFRADDHAQVIGFRGVRSRCGGQAIDVREINH
ncbi:MAG TPA: hypothetical protein VMW27_07965 [Thermoanaerobaculia bacterium]|nr:hypothetical protein [Thermoanaerobaculia bacterium]